MGYTSQTISNYNDDPPPDDGSAVAANQVKFSTVKDELADPIRVLAQAINTELLSAFSSLFLGNTENKATTFNVATTDDGTLFNCTAPLTVNLPPAVDAGEGFAVVIFNNSGGTITIDGDSSETINGNATVTLTNDLDAFILVSTGSLWHGIKIETLSGLLGDDNTFTGSNTFSGNNTFSGTNTFSSDVTFTGDVLFPGDGELTISSGVITVTGVYHTVDTESDAASDDLNTINTGVDGQILILRPDNTARTIVIKDGTGNIETNDGDDITLDTTEKNVSLIFDGTLSKWLVISSKIAGIFTKEFISSDTAIVQDAKTTFAHSLPAIPKLIQCVLVNTTAELGYSVGDEVTSHVAYINDASVGIRAAGLWAAADSTNVEVVVGETIIAIANQTTGVRSSITTANWNYKVRAWS